MGLTQLQSDVLRCLSQNRSETSYLAGGLMLNKSWQRDSDDIDIFHDTDEEVTQAAKADLAVLEAGRAVETVEDPGVAHRPSLPSPNCAR